MGAELDAYHDLSASTLTPGGLTFIHQHVEARLREYRIA